MPKQRTGQLAGQKKWLVARYPKPQGKILFLGSILTDPANPETSLNRRSLALQSLEQYGGDASKNTTASDKALEARGNIDEIDKFDDTAAVRQQIHSELSASNSALLRMVPPNTPLFSAGIKAEAHSSKDIQTTVEAMNVSAQSFIPSPEYIDAALSKAEVTEYVKGCAWSKPLYMVVGVATASALAISEAHSREKGAALSGSTVAPGVNVDVEVSRADMAKAEARLETKNTTDFAYRVREFEYKKFKRAGNFSDKGDRSEGAMFGNERNVERELNKEDVVPKFDGWVGEDVDVDEMLVLRT